MTQSNIPAFCKEYQEKKEKNNRAFYFEAFRNHERELYKIQGHQVWRIYKQHNQFGNYGKTQIVVDYSDNAPQYQIDMIKSSITYHPVSQQLFNSMLDQVIMHLKSL